MEPLKRTPHEMDIFTLTLLAYIVYITMYIDIN